MITALRSLVVAPTERGLERRPGRPTRVLAPGRHPLRLGASYDRVDVREQMTLLAPQEVLSADSVTLRATAAIRWAVAEPVAFVEASADPVAVVYLAVQVALRDALADQEAAAIVRGSRNTLASALTLAARAASVPLGIEVRAVVVKDVLLPAELRAAYAEALVVRQRGQAQLEAARAETAALRSMANAARLLDDHPALARLKLVQALPHGATVVLGRPGEVGSGEA